MINAKFRGTKLVSRDLFFREVGMLTGDFGKEVLAEYKQRVEKDFDGSNNLDVLGYSSGVVRGSNPFVVAFMNSIVRPLGLRTASQADLERALQAGMDLRGTYSDTSLVLRNEDNQKAYIGKNLTEQIKARGKMKLPVVIPLSGLDLVKDGKSDYGLAFKLRDDAKLIYAPILNSPQGNFISRDIDLETGLPKKLGKGNRALYTRQIGLSRLYLDIDWYLDARDGGLGYSSEGGRVLLASTQEVKPAQTLFDL
jgi:hypothetical protein